jgi:predicted flap endonuclease-1-like 5' DNA nuclease
MNRKLVKVQLGPHRFAKMYEEDAIKRGLLKKQAPAANKMVAPHENKMIAPQEEKREAPEFEKEQWDDFTEIHGVGKATADLLREHGVHYFDELLYAQIDFVNPKAKQALELWRKKLLPSASE